MMGAPGSGKSTFIKSHLLNNGKKYIIISTDDIIDEEAKKRGKTYTDIWKTFFKKASKEANRNFKQAIENNDNIIYDQTNWYKEKRKGILDAVGADYYKIGVYFTTPLDVIKDRVIKRGKETGKIIPMKVVEDMYNNMDEPTVDEGFDEIILVGEDIEMVLDQ